MYKKNEIKSLQIIPFILLILVLYIIAKTPFSSGYELSIYHAYPWYFWLFFIGAMLLSIFLIVQEVFTEKKTNQWILGFSAILMGNFILLLLPIFRGYCFYGGANSDLFSHIGYIKEILQSAYISGDNFYPIIHIFILSISDLLGVSVNDVIQFIPAFFSVLYIPFTFLLARSISKNIEQTLLITAFSVPLIFSILQLTIHPAFFSFVFLPLLLSLYHKINYFQRKFEMGILIILLCFFIVFFHPVTTLISIIIFVVFIGSFFILRKYKSLFYNCIITIKHHKATGIVLILTVSFFAWYTSFRSGLINMSSIFQNLIFGSDFSIAKYNLVALSTANLTVFQIIRLVILKYGAIIIYSAIAFSCLLITGKKFVFSKKIEELDFLYSLQLVIAFLYALTMIFGDFIEANPIRTSRYFLLVATIINGLILYRISKKTKNKKEHTMLLPNERDRIDVNKTRGVRINKKIIPSSMIVIILLFSTVLCTFNVYPSPITWESNRQFTHMNFAGSAWIVENRNMTILTSGDIGFNLEKMEHYTNGIVVGKMRTMNETIYMPTHFGYFDNNTLSWFFNNATTYMVTTENGRRSVEAFPENVQSKVHQWSEWDTTKLNAEINIYQIYTNGEFEVRELYVE